MPQQIVFWLFGSLLKASWSSVQAITLILAVAVPVLARDVSSLTALWLGEANAASLGLDIERRRRRSFVLVALLTAGAVSFTGGPARGATAGDALARRGGAAYQ
ncbi:iron ABC transporter permease [Cereibacter azotoformans]|uniref:FecCD transport family protein n=1 Tax=Cereibacter azotoformans TaxID=43057 RepID=A0A2T5K9Y5_9RHOB|nr:iron chelate uptake ABC transporter family permease subunit [Cereibacter azotoformans]PTR19233.1 FecCD transport family protein [Cereibacter azotoformans]UIJ32440.1 iron ABC transporter permease [Cereibacter azotoformans]